MVKITLSTIAIDLLPHGSEARLDALSRAPVAVLAPELRALIAHDVLRTPSGSHASGLEQVQISSPVGSFRKTAKSTMAREK
jgi:hypothetical protein